jgi:hypothetical protein
MSRSSREIRHWAKASLFVKRVIALRAFYRFT